MPINTNHPHQHTRAMQALTVLLKQLGVEALGLPLMQLLATTATAVLKGEAPCQVRRSVRCSVRHIPSALQPSGT